MKLNASPFSDEPPPLDLSVDDVKKHLKFLRGLHKLGITMRPITSKMLDRYISRWLPLLAGRQKLATDTAMMMIPPPDVAWLWHCHRLAPKHYEAYTLLHFGFVVEPCPSFVYQLDGDAARQSEHEDFIRLNDEADVEMLSVELAEAAAFTKTQWSLMFRSDPFFLSLEGDDDESHVLNDPNANEVLFNEEFIIRWSKKLEGFDLIASAACQASFLWQVSGPRFCDDVFLEAGIKEYYKFLLLKDDGMSLPLVPTYQIDLIWHTHILVNCNQYAEDCTRIRGGPFHHDDSLNDRAPGAKLDQAFIATSYLWKETYGTKYYVDGAMYRGEPPTAFYDTANWNANAGIDAGDRMAIDPLVNMSSPPSMNRHEILVGGSSSAGSNIVDGSKWPNPSGSNLFIAAVSKSTKCNVNNNPYRDDYVFGVGSLGLGYYSPQTLDAWKILRLRLTKKACIAKQNVDSFDCSNCLCLGCTPTRSQVQNKDILIKEWISLERKLAFVTAKCNCVGPSFDPDPAEFDKYIRARLRNNPELNEINFMVYSTYVCLAAGGCGGGTCGGGGCGGGGCGGGGCGGGGCGGGGCGG
ncbi:hypothetical protein ACHAXA_001521 [Cyclostephanos tholiformis]|uniref:Uncharacterized protein n=1 Tax=Cyclostephanos tholiformis TaxID=382380 RepID=A0ABD3RX59_9STRA